MMRVERFEAKNSNLSRLLRASSVSVLVLAMAVPADGIARRPENSYSHNQVRQTGSTFDLRMRFGSGLRVLVSGVSDQTRSGNCSLSLDIEDREPSQFTSSEVRGMEKGAKKVEKTCQQFIRRGH